MKKIVTLLLTVAMAATLLVGCGNDEKTFTVGFDAEFPPYGYQDDNGEYVGFDLDLAAEVCKRNDWTLEKQPINWDSKDMELDAGTIDCIWNGFTMTGRESEYTWTCAYIDNSQVFVVKADSGITTQADLAGKDVGVQADSSALVALENEEEGGAADLAKTFASLTQYGDYNTGFMELETGVIDALAMDIGVAQYQISSRGDEYVMLEEKLATEQYAVGFKLGNTELRDKVEKTLLEMAEDGTVLKIAKEWGLEDQLCIGK
ncbi:MAG: amino acid ABC transporter substrate-binding protein [Lachnospiraceae bacterium]|nr:amino acid ABC transporter substrate-binding protein [Lachnospiraceae bacterium]